MGKQHAFLLVMACSAHFEVFSLAYFLNLQETSSLNAHFADSFKFSVVSFNHTTSSLLLISFIIITISSSNDVYYFTVVTIAMIPASFNC